jgi:hypothetical protein
LGVIFVESQETFLEKTDGSLEIYWSFDKLTKFFSSYFSYEHLPKTCSSVSSCNLFSPIYDKLVVKRRLGQRISGFAHLA